MIKVSFETLDCFLMSIEVIRKKLIVSKWPEYYCMCFYRYDELMLLLRCFFKKMKSKNQSVAAAVNHAAKAVQHPFLIGL